MYADTVEMAIYQNVEPDVRARELTKEELGSVGQAVVGKHTETLIEIFRKFGDDPFTASEVALIIKGAAL